MSRKPKRISHQSTALGELEKEVDPVHPDADTREKILNLALTAWGWTADIQRHEQSGFVKFTANCHKANASYELEIFVFPNLASAARPNKYEKRIQITRPYQEHETEFRIDKTGEKRCLLLGFYHLNDDEVVICAWDAAEYQDHANPTSCYVDIRAIADAFRTGFGRSKDKKGRYVYCFRPEFTYYYVENMAYLHVVELRESGDTGKSPGKSPTTAKTPALRGGENVIFYGAPGTGKTHTVDKMADGKFCVRTVFHPDIQNSDFIGALKPVMEDDRVTYAFSPGPFALALRDALAKPDSAVFLVIEELNRAPAAAVFGDIFLLLDRDKDGAGRYDVNFPTPEFKEWIRYELRRDIERISLPSNLSLLATMNSADQGVYPIDTAFRRRWRQEYIPIDYSNAPSGSLEIVRADGTICDMEWEVFAKTINDHLSDQLDIAEDRLLGPWFVTQEDLAHQKLIPGKVLIYLWDDLLRHTGRDRVFYGDKLKTFGKISEHVKDSKRIFADALLEKFEAVKPKS